MKLPYKIDILNNKNFFHDFDGKLPSTFQFIFNILKYKLKKQT